MPSVGPSLALGGLRPEEDSLTIKTMTKAPIFFLTGATPENQEAQYAELAKYCKCEVPNVSMRLYLIFFSRRGVKLRATVGEKLTALAVANLIVI